MVVNIQQQVTVLTLKATANSRHNQIPLHERIFMVANGAADQFDQWSMISYNRQSMRL